MQPGARVGAYEILSAIGAGGMDEVYRARDTRLECTVAIKVLPAEMIDAANVAQLSPVMPAMLGWSLTQARRYDDAIAPLKRVLELEPDYLLAHFYLVGAYVGTGKGDLAIAESRRTIELGNPFGQACLQGAMPRQGGSLKPQRP